jgi:hypothetical protein
MTDRRRIQALTIVMTGSGHNRTLIQCRVQYRMRGLMSGILARTPMPMKSTFA